MMNRLLLLTACAVLLAVGAVGGTIPNQVIVFIDLSATGLTQTDVANYAKAYIAKAALSPQAGVSYGRLTPDDSGLLGAIDKPISIVDTSGDPLHAVVYLSAILSGESDISAILVGDSSLVTSTILNNFLFEMSRSSTTAARFANTPVVSFLETSDDICVPTDVSTSAIGAANHIVCATVRDRAEVVGLVDTMRNVLEWESFGIVTGSAASVTTASSTATATITKSTTELLYEDVLAAQTGTSPSIPLLTVVSSLQRFTSPVDLSAADVQAADDSTLKTLLRRYVRGIVLHSINDEEYDRLVASRNRLANVTGSTALFFLATKSSVNRLSTMTAASTTHGAAIFTPHYTSCSALATAASAAAEFSTNCDERGALLMSNLMDSLMLFMAAPSTANKSSGAALVTAANMYAGSFTGSLTAPSGGAFGKFRFTTAAQAAGASATQNVYNSPLVTVSTIAPATLVKNTQTTTAPSQRLDTAFHLRSMSYDGLSPSASTSIAVWSVTRTTAVFVTIESLGRAIIVSGSPRLIPSSVLRSATVCILTPPNLADVANSVRLFAQLDYHNRAVFKNLTSSVVDTAVAITPVLLNTGTDGVAVISTLLPMLSSSAASATSCTIVVGPGRGRYNTAIAPLLSRYAIPQMEFTESDPAEIADPVAYPYMTSVTPSDTIQYNIIADICAKFNWESVVVINVAEETARQAAVLAALQQQTISVENTYSLTSWPLVNSTTTTLSTSMQQLKEVMIKIRDTAISRIVIPILPVSDTDAKLFLDMALELGMNGTQIFIFDSFMSRYLNEERWTMTYYKGSRTTLSNDVLYNNTFQASAATEAAVSYASDDLSFILKQASPTLRQLFPSSICVKPALGGSSSNNNDPALAVVRQLPYYLHMSPFEMRKQNLTFVESDGLTEAEEAAALATLAQAITDAEFPTDIVQNLRTHVGRGVFDLTPGDAPVNSSRLLVDQWVDNGAYSAFAVDAGLALIELLALVDSTGNHPVTRTKLFEAMRSKFGQGNNASLEYPLNTATSPPQYITSSLSADAQDTAILNRGLQAIFHSTVGSIGNGFRLERIAGTRVETSDVSFLVDIQLPAETASSGTLYQTVVDKLNIASGAAVTPADRQVSPFGDVLTFGRWKDAGSVTIKRLSYILPSDTRITWLDGTQTYSGNPDILPPTSSIRSIQFIAVATLTASPGAIAFSVLGFGVTVAVFIFCYRRYKTQQLILAELYAMDDETTVRRKYQPVLRTITNDNDMEEGIPVTDVYRNDQGQQREDSTSRRRDDVIYQE